MEFNNENLHFNPANEDVIEVVQSKNTADRV